MEFKNGDRIHVKRLYGYNVDFYATFNYLDNDIAELTDCSLEEFNTTKVYLPVSLKFGPYRVDYYILALDEEDSEEPEVQHISGKNYLNTQFVVEVNKGVYVQKIKGNTFKFTKNIEEALFFSYYFESIADDIVEQLNGKKYEVVRYMEG
ncbi:hypothetical protein ACFP67_14040 [Mammaliicoccus sciuri]|uniref:hypothetical protein n=1 Tax=Mammaliicoccus sciuri TaxID=1296 RepID=UPI000CD1F04C|nr:hypothetical protein [Mammaliicoccus sciuri]PNZ30010.1 hypothetical protein CD114_01270 [Mammaliicoccus sciuri]